MLAIQKSKSHRGKCIPNVLACRINHNGPVDASKRYWDPRVRDGKTTSYFRGRKLYARKLAIGGGYKGVVVRKTDRVLPPTSREEEDGEEGGEEGGEEIVPEVKIVEEVGSFEEVWVWGHEVLADEGDAYVRGVEEWIGFAESIHGFGMGENGDGEKKG